MNLDQNLSTSVPVCTGPVVVSWSVPKVSPDTESTVIQLPQPAGLGWAGSWRLGKLAAGRMLNVAKLVVMPALIIAAAAHWCRPHH